MTYEAYLAFDDASTEKHEFWEGQVFAMAGGTLAHARIAANLIRHLGNQLDGTPCAVFTADARIRAEGTKNAAYPDVSIICGPPERQEQDPNTATNPKVLIEVLSNSTEAFDRGKKFAYYRKMQSLRTYVLVSQQERRVEVYERTDTGALWTFRAFETGDALFASVSARIAIDDIYKGVAEL
jgi:Uma2 family endonuclease